MLEYIPEILKGLHTSLTLTIVSLLVALVLSVVFTIVLTLKTPIATPLVKIYITLFTGTPLLVQIFLIYYGPGAIPGNPRISVVVESAVTAMAVRNDCSGIEQCGVYHSTVLRCSTGYSLWPMAIL